MELSYRRHCGNPFPTELRQLISFRSINVHKTVHISDAKAVNGIWWVTLPLCSKTVIAAYQFHCLIPYNSSFNSI